MDPVTYYRHETTVKYHESKLIVSHITNVMNIIQYFECKYAAPTVKQEHHQLLVTGFGYYQPSSYHSVAQRFYKILYNVLYQLSVLYNTLYTFLHNCRAKRFCLWLINIRKRLPATDDDDDDVCDCV